MANDELKLDGRGRKSKIRPLTMRGGQQPKDKPKDRPQRSWAEQKARIARTVNRVPEVVVKVSGGGTTQKRVMTYKTYITRNGQLEAIDDKGEKILGKEALKESHESWDMDLMRGKDRLHQSFNVILSMPKGTPPDKVLAAVQNFASEQLDGYQYLMVLHTPETDPDKPPPDHPHVHLVVRAENNDGERLYIRKDRLQTWRECFAEKLREQGIEANATRRSERGVSLKSKKSAAEYRIGKDEKRKGQSTAFAKRFNEAAAEVKAGKVAPKPWEKAMEARRRDVERELAANAAKLRQEGDVALAAAVDRFARDLPPIVTERQAIQQAILEQRNERLQQKEQRTHHEPDQER